MAQQPAVIMQDMNVAKSYWGSATHEQCLNAIDPCDSYLKLYKKQYRKSSKRLSCDCDDYKKDKDGNLIYPKHINFRTKTMDIINPTINDILFDDTVWNKHFRYKHKNKSYLEKAAYESFNMWYHCVTNENIHQIPQKKQRNCITLVPITDNSTYFIDDKLITSLEELIHIYFGLKIKQIDVSNTNNVIFRKNNFGNFVTKDIHHKLSTYYNNDKDIFAIVGICSKIGIFSGSGDNDNNNKVIHGEHNDSTQSAVVSFSKLGVYNKLQRNIPQWLKIRRSGKILLHEIAHLFGLSHCEYFRCLMNKDVVLDCVPMHLCPICLNKLYYAMIKENNHRNTFEYDLVQTAASTSVLAMAEEIAIIIRGGTDDEKEKKRKKKKKMRMKIDNNTFNLYQRYKDLAEWFNQNKCFREATWYNNRIMSLSSNVINDV